MTKDTARFLLNMLNQQNISLGQENVMQVVAVASAARAELIKVIEDE